MDWPSDEASFRIKTNIGVLGNAHTCVKDLTYVRWPENIGAFLRAFMRGRANIRV